MRHRTDPSPARGAWPWAALAAITALIALAACGAPGRDLAVKVARAPRLTPTLQMGEEVGRLLSPDPEVSKSAERRLMALDEEGRDRLVAYAGTLEGERDVRLLNVLDEHHALPDLPAQEKLDFLLWKAARPERFYVMKAQSRLIELARDDPGALIERLRRGGRGFAALTSVVTISGIRDAIPALLHRYRHTRDPAERAAAAEGLAQLVGGAHRPRLSGSAREIETDAAAVERWYQDQLELEREEAQDEGGADGS